MEHIQHAQAAIELHASGAASYVVGHWLLIVLGFVGLWFVGVFLEAVDRHAEPPIRAVPPPPPPSSPPVLDKAYWYPVGGPAEVGGRLMQKEDL